jgi:CRISPR-associated endonuclease/helicase Cas3
MQYLAHRDNDTGKEQSLIDHLISTAELCKENAIPIFKDIAWLCGYYHDVGKYSELFQKRVRNIPVRVSHADCGAVEIDKQYNIPFKYMLEYCIAGHHTGLQDGGTCADNETDGTLWGTLKAKHEDYSAFKTEISDKKLSFDEFMSYFQRYCKDNEEIFELFAFFTKYIYSCLTDADFIDTERFFGSGGERGEKANLKAALDKLDSEMKGFVCDTKIKAERPKLQQQALKNMDYNANIHILNMPTGSGKTLCSAKLALETAIRCNKKRIIYVIPYNSIIEQTAETLGKIFGDSLPILQHHSNYDFDKAGDETTAEKLKRSCENWDYPMIITTNIQFFQSVYDYKSSKLRKLHNMADSVIIFDEIHTLPYKYLKPCFRAIGYITEHLKSHAILLSATMPDYTNLFEKHLANNKINKLITDYSGFKVFDKCNYSYIGECSDETIAQKSSEHSSLIVVNSRKKARELYKKIDGTKYHLSTYMTSKQRSEIIEEIKKKLAADENITVVSTSLIEVGVDLDFCEVFRETAGLENILQAGGRCNRDGKRDWGNVYVFDFDDTPIYKGDLSVNANVTRSLFSEYENVSDLKCIEEYFKRLLKLHEDDIEANTIFNFNGACTSFDSIPFRSFSKSFKLIENESFAVVIPDETDEELKELIKQLENGKLSVKRALQRYCANVKKYELEKLIKCGVIDDYGTGLPVLTDSDYYDKDMGLLLEVNKDYIV